MQPARLRDESWLEEISLEELQDAAEEASAEAIRDLKAHGISVFYYVEDALVREDPNGQRFEVEWDGPERAAHRVIRALPS
jgi:methionine synthase II (cobalamin-independent)